MKLLVNKDGKALLKNNKIHSIEGTNPKGTLAITKNGIYKVLEYKNVEVNVPSNGGLLKPLLDMSKSLYRLFYNYQGESIEGLIQYSDTENVENFSYMFNYCKNLTSIPLINTSKGTKFNDMFSYCTSLETIPSLDTSNGTRFDYMFEDCRELTNIPYLDTSNGTDFKYMFGGCIKLLEVPSLDTSNGTSFYRMFYGCKKLINIPLLNTSKGTNFGSMFHGCDNLTQIPLLNTSKGTSFYSMFRDCNNLTSVPQIDTSSGTDFAQMFNSCYKIQKIDITKLTSSASNETDSLCNYCYRLKALIIRSFGDSYVLGSYAFRYCYRLLHQASSYNPENAEDGYIYVPRDMIPILSQETNWSVMHFRALEDYTHDGACWGEFDDAKAGLI